jgi:O-antigen/teichoic acid export membrane protein
LLLASVFQGANQLNGTILRAVGRPGVEGVAQGAGVVMTAAMLWAVLPRYGIEGAAWVSLVVYVGIGVLQLLVLARVHGAGPAALVREVGEVVHAAVHRAWERL